jgi:hypothetical protein
VCGAIVAGTTWFDDLTKRSFDREEVITTVMFRVQKITIEIKAREMLTISVDTVRL